MPINYHVKEPLHCSRLDPALRDSIQGCKYKRDEIPEFKPMNRIKSDSSNVNSKAKKTVSIIKQLEPIIPVTLGKTSNVEISNYNNNGFSIFSNQPTISINEDTNNNENTNNNQDTNKKKKDKKKDKKKTPVLLKPQKQLTTPRPVTEFENFGSKGKLIDIAYQIDKEIQDQIERADLEYNDSEGRRNVEEAIFEELDNFEYMMDKAGLGDWKIDPELSTKSYLVLNNENETQIFFRGRAGNQDLISGEEGKFKNVFEKILAGDGGDRAGRDTRHVIETLSGNKRDYSYIDDLHSKIKEKYPNSNLEVISYSDGGPKGMHMSEKFNIKHTMMDGVIGPLEVKLLNKRTSKSAPLEMVRPANTKGIASTMGLTAYQIKSGRTAPPNAKLTNIPTYSNNPIEAHGAENFSDMQLDLRPDPSNPEGEPLLGEDVFKKVEGQRITPKFNAKLANIKAGAASTGISILSSWIVDQLLPDANQDLKNALAAGGTSAGQKVAAPVLGLGGMSMKETFLPLFASFEAATYADKAMDAVLPEDMNIYERDSARGATAGGVAYTTYGATAAAQSKVLSGISKIAQMSRGTTAAAEIGETTPLLAEAGEAAEVAEAAEAALAATEAAEAAEAAAAATEAVEAAEAALAAAETAEAAVAVGEGVAVGATVAEGAAAGSFLGPVGLLGGLVVGAGIGIGAALYGEHEKAKAEKEAEEARKKADAAQELRDQAIAAQEQIRREQKARRDEVLTTELNNDLQYVRDTPQIGTTYQERLDWLDKNRAKYASDQTFEQLANSDYDLAYEKQIQYIVMREQEKLQRAGELYSAIENDQLYQLALQTKEIPRINQAIKNIVMADEDTYGDFLNNEAPLPQLDKDGSWIHATFDSDNHIWSDSPNDFTAEEPQSELSSLKEPADEEPTPDTKSWSFIYPDNFDNTNNNP